MLGQRATRQMRHDEHGKRQPSVLNRVSFADQAFGYLHHQIACGAYGEGERLPSEAELCTIFGISRPVVREALKRLRDEGLVESIRGAGTFVKRHRAAPTTGAMVDGRLRELLMKLEFRKVVEPACAKLAAQRRTDADLLLMKSALDEFEETVVKAGKVGRHLDFRFHLAIATATGNHRFAEAISAIEYDTGSAIELARFLARYNRMERSMAVWEEHQSIYLAIERNDDAEAYRLMSAHLDEACTEVMRLRSTQTQSK